MKQRIIDFIRWLFGRKSVSSVTPAEAKPATTENKAPLPAPHPCIGRIRMVLSRSGIRRWKGRAPGVWYVKAKDFTDAYRLLLRLGKQEGLACIKRGGHIRYRLTLPDKSGCIMLSDRVGHRRNTLAVMVFDVTEMSEIKEIRFLDARSEAT